MNKKKKSLAVLGANGLVGHDLASYLGKKFDVTSITRENYKNQKGKKFDVFINANGNSSRFWALQNIYEDFEVSTESVYKSLFDFKFGKYIYVSSVDVYAKTESLEETSENSAIDVKNLNAYGLHKYLSEQIIKNATEDNIILRLSMVVGKNLKKGPFFDIINNRPLFLTPDSKLQIITTFAVSEVIDILINKKTKNKIYNIGGDGSIDFDKIGKYFKVSVKWSVDALKQHYEMDVSKLKTWYKLKTSEDYLKDWINEQKI